MDEKQKIIEFGEEKFFKEGFHKTTMDDVASELRMSKKTIYKFFPSKEDLVRAIAKHFMNGVKNKIIASISTDNNAIEKLEALMKVLASTSHKISPRMLDEMRRHLPTLWTEIDNFRAEMMFGNITKIIDQGKAEGLFLDYPTPVIMNMLVASVRAVANPEFVINNNFSLIEAALIIFRIILGGITTEKGKRILNKTFK